MTFAKQFADVIDKHNNIGIISHCRPDGDAIGSTLGLGLMLRELGKNVQMYNTDSFPERFDYLNCANFIEPVPLSWPNGMTLLIVVDAGDIKLLGEAGAKLFEMMPATMNIDHHSTNLYYADYNFVEPGASACATVITKMLFELGYSLTEEIAQALYTGISTDTGSFQFSSVNTETMKIAGELIDCGIDVGKINQHLYQEVSIFDLLYQRHIINKIKWAGKNRIVYYSLTSREVERHCLLHTRELNPAIWTLQKVKGAVVAATFEEKEKGLIHVSLRSKDVRINVAKIAEQFGGGGHVQASGARVNGSLRIIRKKVLAAISQELDKYDL